MFSLVTAAEIWAVVKLSGKRQDDGCGNFVKRSKAKQTLIGIWGRKAMNDKCLVCGDEKNIYPLKCKMCGMGIRNARCAFRGFVFCSIKCRDAFARIMDLADEKGKEYLINAPIVI